MEHIKNCRNCKNVINPHGRMFVGCDVAHCTSAMNPHAAENCESFRHNCNQIFLVVIYNEKLAEVTKIAESQNYGFVTFNYIIHNIDSIYNECGYYTVCCLPSIFNELYEKHLVEIY
jgi:hypothetical protein